MSTYRNRSYVVSKDPLLAEALDDVMSHVVNIAHQTNAALAGAVVIPPPNAAALNVAAANGIFDISITDSSPVVRGINYFVEYSTSASFSNPTVLDLGASRNDRRYLGNLTLFFRAYSSYPHSARSSPVYFGPASNPTAVIGGGSAGPTPLVSNGSGTSLGSSGSDGGFGNNPFRGANRPTTYDRPGF